MGLCNLINSSMAKLVISPNNIAMDRQNLCMAILFPHRGSVWSSKVLMSLATSQRNFHSITEIPGGMCQVHLSQLHIVQGRHSHLQLPWSGDYFPPGIGVI